MNLIYQPEAAEELEEAVTHYYQQNPDAGIGLLHAVDRIVEQLEANPLQFAPHSHGTRKAIPRPYPYLIIFRLLEPELVEVVAVMHQARQADYWQERL